MIKQASTTKVIPITDIFLDFADEGGYQRRRSEDEAIRIAEHYDPDLFEIPHVSDRSVHDLPLGPNGERYSMPDGGARLMAAELMGWKSLKCEVHVFERVEDEAKLFADLATGRKSITPLDTFFARLREGSGEHVALSTILESAGWKISTGSGKRSISAVQQTMSAYRNYGEIPMRRALMLLEAWDEDEHVSGPILAGMVQFVAEYGSQIDMDSARRKLAKVPMSTIYRRAKHASQLSSNAGKLSAHVVGELLAEYNRGRRTTALVAA